MPDIRLEVRDLRVVVALAAAGSTAKAAATLHLTQPAVSRALLAAEDKLGAKLFDRTTRGLVPTPAGRELLDGATRLLAELGDLEQRVRAPVAAPAKIRVVCECYTAYHWLPTALTSLRAGLPGLDLSLAIEHTLDPVAALEAGTVDVALLTSSKVPRGGLEEATLFADEIVLVLAASHPLAAKKALTAADLRTTTLLSPPVSPAASKWFVGHVFGPRPPALRFQFLPITEAILDVARAGMGVAVLSEWIAGPHLGKGDLLARPLAAGPLRRPWRIAWRREVADAATRLRSVLGTVSPRSGFDRRR